jgi:hypothetical protein
MERMCFFMGGNNKYCKAVYLHDHLQANNADLYIAMNSTLLK